MPQPPAALLTRCSRRGGQLASRFTVAPRAHRLVFGGRYTDVVPLVTLFGPCGARHNYGTAGAPTGSGPWVKKPDPSTGDASLRRTVLRTRRRLRWRHAEETVSRTTGGQDSSTSSAETRRGDAMLNSTECKTDPKTLGKFIFEKWRAFPHRGLQFLGVFLVIFDDNLHW